MVFYILISIVFLAELIITFAIITNMKKLDKIFAETNFILEEAKPKIISIASTIKKISEQLTELAPIWVENTKEFFISILSNHLKGVATGIAIWAIRKYIHND